MLDVDLSGVKTVNDVEAIFLSLARDICSRYEIHLGHLESMPPLRISSVEFYLFKKGVWEDPTVHGPKYGSLDQLESGHWYVHKWAGGKFYYVRRRGVDITVGNKRALIYASLLIRAVNEFNGPARALNSIMTGVVGPAKRAWTYSAATEDFMRNSLDGCDVRNGVVSLREERARGLSRGYIGRRLNLGGPKKPEHREIYDSKLRFSTFDGPGLKPAPWQ